MSLVLNGTNGVTYNDGTLQSSAPVGKNRIINGNMAIDQRNAGVSVTPTNAGYTLDRWQTYISPLGKYTVQQDAGAVTPPVGFTNYLGATSTSAYSITSGDYFSITQNIEGYNIADLAWGTADAKTITISFWVRSSLTGTFGGSLRNSAANRSYPFSYTISVANTWEQKSITVAGDTTGAWLTDNGKGVSLNFGLGVGSTRSGTAGAWAAANYLSATGATSVVGTSSATFYITGVQLETGTTATDFEHLQYGQQLALCQRYCVVLNHNVNQYVGTLGYCQLSNALNGILLTTNTMRTTPTVTVDGDYRVLLGNTAPTLTGFTLTPTMNNAGVNIGLTSVTGATFTSREPSRLLGGTTPGSTTLSAEL
jgi:hypothetical protein